jgi:hypothetical protein
MAQLACIYLGGRLFNLLLVLAVSTTIAIAKGVPLGADSLVP